MTPKENIVSKSKASVSWIYSNILGKTAETHLRTPNQNAQAREEYISWVSYLLPIEQALNELEELKKEVIARQETENSLTKWVAELTNELEALKKTPTSDEVCKELSNELKETVLYSEKTKQFYYRDFDIDGYEHDWFVTETYGDDRHSINSYIPPHLITMIGKFYESLEGEK